MDESLPDVELLRRVRSWTSVPPLRIDLRIVRTPGSRLLRLCDPATLKFVELYELESMVAQAIDGQRTLDGLTEFARGYNPAIRREQIEELVVQLSRMG